MSDFFEKLKKGMDSTEIAPETEAETTEPSSTKAPKDVEPTEELADAPVEEAVAEFTSSAIDPYVLPEEEILAEEEPVETPKKKPKKKAAKKKPVKKKPKKLPKIEEPQPEKIEISPSSDESPKGVEVPEEQEEEVVETSSDFFDGPVGELTVDVYQSGKDLIIRSAIGGIEAEDLDIVIENDFVVIKGGREEVLKEETKEFFFQECHWGSFKREIALPVEIDSSRAKAKLEKGILVIRMPIIENKSKTKVSIE